MQQAIQGSSTGHPAGAFRSRAAGFLSGGRAALLWLIFLSLTVALGLYAYRWHQRFLTTEAEEHRIIELGGTIEHLDEVLTMSARMAAATGDAQWESRYRSFEPELERAIREAMQLSKEANRHDVAMQLNASNAALVEMETRAFDLIRNGNRSAAMSLLKSPAYEDQKQIYGHGLDNLLRSLRNRWENESRMSERDASRALAGVILLVCLGISLLVLNHLLRRQTREKRRAQQEIKLQYDFLNNVLESLSHPFYVIDAADYTIKLSNKAGRAVAGEEATTCYQLSHGRDRPCDGNDHPCPLQIIRETREPVLVEHTHYTPDQGPREMEIHCHPVLDGEGKVAQVIQYSLDITERKRAERQTRESETYLKAIQDNIETGIVVLDAETHEILYVNPAAQRMIGATAEEIRGKACHKFICRAEAGECPVTDLNQTLRNQEAVLLTADGRELPILKTVVPVTLSGRKCLLDTFVDISDRKKMLETLSESEQKFRAIAASAQDAIVMMDPAGRVSYWNEAAEGIFWWSSQEVMGREMHPLLAPEKYRDAWSKGEETFRTTGSGAAMGKTLEMTALRKDGHELPIEISLAAVNLEEQWHAIGIIRDITDRKRGEEELRRAKEEAEQSTHSLNLYALEVEQKNIELEHAGRQAEEASQTKSEFLANMSHEIRTPMNGVIGMTGLLLETELTPEQREYAETVRKSGEVLLTLINDILDFSKSEAGRLEFEEIPFDLRTCLEEMGEMLAQKAHEKGLELAILIRYDVPTRVKGDPGRLRQVLLNLANNAIKFTQEGEVLIRVSLAGLEEEQESILFEIIDTGIGIPADRLSRLFRPFSQVDASMTRRYGGTGLGLAISRQIVEAMGGKIRVESREGRGSAFSFTATFARQPDDGTAPVPVHPDEIRNLHVLIVDDITTNRVVFREQFKACGCRTGEAADGPEALDMLRAASRTQDPFQLALIDYQMPEMDGEQLAREIRSNPGIAGIPLILVTSVPRRGDAAKMVRAGFDAYLVKPVKQSKLYETLAAVLGIRQSDGKEAGRRLVTRHSLKEFGGVRCRVLVVEDNIVNQRVATRMLEKRGCRCDVAANGREAVEALERITYDIVLMDCQMPEMDGYEATREIRKRENGDRHTPIIAMTANVMKGDRERCMEAGMDDYLTKPVNAPSLYALLEKHLAETLPPPGESAEKPEAGAAAPVELGNLREASDGDALFEKELVLHFLQDTEQRLMTLYEALRERNAPALRREAHTIRGAGTAIGAEALGEIAGRLERLAAGNDIDRTTEALTSLRSEFQRVRIALQGHLELQIFPTPQ